MFRILIILSSIIKLVSTICFFFFYQINSVFMPFLWYSVPYSLASFYDDTISKFGVAVFWAVLVLIVILSIILPIMLLIETRKIAVLSSFVYIVAIGIDVVCGIVSCFSLINIFKLLSILINIIFIVITVWYIKLLKTKQSPLDNSENTPSYTVEVDN